MHVKITRIQVALVGLVEKVVHTVRCMWQEVDALPQSVGCPPTSTSRPLLLKYTEPLLSHIDKMCGSVDEQIRPVRQRLRNLCSRIKQHPALTWPTVMAFCYETCKYHSASASASAQLIAGDEQFQLFSTGEGKDTMPFYHRHSTPAMSMASEQRSLKKNNAEMRILQLLTKDDDLWALYSDGWLRCWRDVSIHRQRDDQYTTAGDQPVEWPSASGSAAMHNACARTSRRVQIAVDCFAGYPSHAISKILYAPGYHDRGAWLSLAHANVHSAGDMIAINTTAYDDRLWLYSCATGKLVHCVRLQLPQLYSGRGRARVQTSKKIRVVATEFVCSSGLVVCALAGVDSPATALGVPQIVLFDVQTGRMQGQLEAQVCIWYMFQY